MPLNKEFKGILGNPTIPTCKLILHERYSLNHGMIIRDKSGEGESILLPLQVCSGSHGWFILASYEAT